MLLILLSAFQEVPIEKLAEKCDSQIAWRTDGSVLRDNEGRRRAPEKLDTLAVLEKAKAAAKERKRLIFWYVPRVWGSHMYRAAIPDQYARAAFFTHPDVVELVQRKFVPMRVVADRAIGEATGIRRFGVVEPAIVLLTPEGKPVHTIERIRTFNADGLVEVLATILQKHNAYNAVADGATVDDLILGGDYEKAAAKGPSPYQKAQIAIRRRRAEEAFAALEELRSPEAHLARGRILLAQGKIDEARKTLEESLGFKVINRKADEARYFAGVAEFYAGQEKKADEHWLQLIRSSPDSPWAWRAAANLTTDQDTLRKGPTTHGFEDVFWPGERGGADDVAKRAVSVLLRMQRSNGGWEDSRYSYWPDAKILPNVWVAVSAVAASALLEWRSVDPERIDAALARAEKYFLDESRMARGQNEESYADAFKILYLARKFGRSAQSELLDSMADLAKRLAGIQQRDGSWAHEYPNPFCTAAVIHALHSARTAGAKFDESLIAKGADALLKSRGEGGTQAYDMDRKPSPMKDSSARVVPCEHALVQAGRLKVQDVANAFDSFWKHRTNLETIRLCDFHSDGELGGFFFFHGLFFTSEAIGALPEADRAAHREKFLDWILSIPERDGSFLDSHELGKSYGTAMALLVLRNALGR